MSFLTVCGPVMRETWLAVRELPRPEHSAPILGRTTHWGGAAGRLAELAAVAGVPTRLWARVGADMPADLRARWLARGLDLRLETEPGRPTPAVVALEDQAGHRALAVDDGALVDVAERPPPTSLVDGMRPGTWLHLASGDPLSYALLADHARTLGIRVALDPGFEVRRRWDARGLEGMLEMADLLWLDRGDVEAACDLLRYGGPEQFLDHAEAVAVVQPDGAVQLHGRGRRSVHAKAPSPLAHDGGQDAGAGTRARVYAGLHDGRTLDVAVSGPGAVF